MENRTLPSSRRSLCLLEGLPKSRYLVKITCTNYLPLLCEIETDDPELESLLLYHYLPAEPPTPTVVVPFDAEGQQLAPLVGSATLDDRFPGD